MKLACIGPLSPLRTGVAHFSENLLPFLAERCEVKLFADPYPPSETSILQEFPAAPISDLASEASGFDAILYHMGNHYRFHRTVFEALWEIPGIVILHDCVLNQFFARYALGRGNFGTFRRLFELCYGDAGSDEALRFCEGKGDPYRFPMAGVVAMRSRGAIVMSEYGAEIVRKEAPGAKILKANHPYFPPRADAESSKPVFERLKIGPDCFVVASVGHMTAAKRIDVAVEAFAKFSQEFPDSMFLLAGQESGGLPVRDIIARQSAANIDYLGYLDDSDLNRLMDRADVFINLRYPSNGEMSGTLLHMLGHGKAVVVSNYAQYAELPDSACVKIDLGPDEADDLARELAKLAHDRERRQRMGEAAKNHIARHHTREEMADAIVQFAQANSETEPLLEAKQIEGLLLPDGFLKRSRQMVVYNTRRFIGHSKEQGLANTARRALKRALVKPSRRA